MSDASEVSVLTVTSNFLGKVITEGFLKCYIQIKIMLI